MRPLLKPKSDDINIDVFYFFLGILVGTFGSMIGAGGGFLLMPILLWQLPHLPAVFVSAISMLAVSSNAISGSTVYVLKKQVHWASAFVFSLASLPGLYLGFLLGERVSRKQFEFIFGLLLISVSLFLALRSKTKSHAMISDSNFSLSKQKILIGMLISVGVGVMASFLGIGGGVIHVPLLTEVLGFPVHLATGTSHLILAITSLFAVIDHFQLGHYNSLENFVPFLLIGVVAGAQIGAQISRRISARWIVRSLAAALFFVGLRLMLH